MRIVDCLFCKVVSGALNGRSKMAYSSWEIAWQIAFGAFKKFSSSWFDRPWTFSILDKVISMISFLVFAMLQCYHNSIIVLMSNVLLLKTENLKFWEAYYRSLEWLIYATLLQSIGNFRQYLKEEKWSFGNGLRIFFHITSFMWQRNRSL